MRTYTNTQDIAAIPSKYDGILFRSRLEARWAHFFNVCHISWEYEPKCFEKELGECVVSYLPDFYFPDFGIWVEVKGTQNNLNADWDSKIYHFADWGGPLCGSNTWGKGKGLLILGTIPIFSANMAKMPMFSFIQHRKGLLQNRAVFDPWSGSLLFGVGDVQDHNFFDYPDLEPMWIKNLYDKDESAYMEYAFDSARKLTFVKGE